MGSAVPDLPPISRSARDRTAKGIVFSLERGQVWASWEQQEDSVHLGSEEEVVPMMEDFLAQVALGKKLCRKPG